MLTATGDRVLRAYNRAAKSATHPDNGAVTRISMSAGFIIPAGQPKGPKEGWQVFVTLHRYSDQKLKDDPLSGGLL